MEELARTTDRWNREVKLRQKGWDHILSEHREMFGREDAILETVENPHRVMWDATFANRENFYRVIADHHQRHPLYLKVCVEYGPSGGTIVTAHPLRRMKRSERQRWP